MRGPDSHSKVEHRILEHIFILPFEEVLVVGHVCTGRERSKGGPDFPGCAQLNRKADQQLEMSARPSLGIYYK